MNFTNFIFDPSLVLYLPLYELDGASFMSRDAYGHLCTKTGALWRPNGHEFDGDDYISKAIADWRSADSEGTIIIWFKTDTADITMFSSADEASTLYYNNFGTTANGADKVLIVSQRNNDTVDAIRGATNVGGNVWHMATYISNGTAYSLYVNAVAESLTVLSGANSGDWFADTPNRDNFVVGALKRSTTIQYFTGTIGDVLAYNRALTPLEIQKIYLATKWRYR